MTTDTDEITGFQTGVEHRPARLVRAASAGDVQQAVRAAAGEDWTVRVQATGHGAGSSVEGGLLLLTGGMDAVQVDAAARTARVSAGATGEQVVAATAPHGLVPAHGSAPSVGAVGYTLGGGTPLLGRLLGYASDHVRSLEVVTADGELRHVTADRDADLFEALCGGRDGLGVVTSMEIALHPLPALWGGSVALDAAAGPEILAAFLAATGDDLPEEVSPSFGMVPMPPAPAVPEPLRGRRVVFVRVAASGRHPEAAELLERVKQAGPVLAERYGPLPLTEAGTIFNEPPFPHTYVGDNALLTGLDAEAGAAVLQAVGPSAPVDSVLDLRVLGGALSRPASTPDAVPYREAQVILRLISALEDPAQAAAARQVHAGAFDVVADRKLGRSLNFVYGDGIGAGGRRDGVFPPQLRRRLAEVIATRDPQGRFGGNRFMG